MVYEIVRTIRRSLDPRLLVSDGQYIHFHPTERIDPLPWSEVRSVSLEEGYLKSDLWFRLRHANSFRIRNCDEREGDEFVQAVNAALSSPAPSAIPPAI